jgi:hypothetical protein
MYSEILLVHRCTSRVEGKGVADVQARGSSFQGIDSGTKSPVFLYSYGTAIKAVLLQSIVNSLVKERIPLPAGRVERRFFKKKRLYCGCYIRLRFRVKQNKGLSWMSFGISAGASGWGTRLFNNSQGFEGGNIVGLKNCLFTSKQGRFA